MSMDSSLIHSHLFFCSDTTSENCTQNNKCKVSSTPSSITVIWDNDAAPKEIESYEIKFRKHGTKKFTTKQVSKNDEELEIDELVSSTLYEINVFWCDEEGTNHPLFQQRCKTEESNAKFLIENALTNQTRQPFLYHLQPVSTDEHPLQIKKNNAEDGVAVTHIRVLDMISEYRPSVREHEAKTLLLLGATGTGKSTLIDALINFIAGVSYNDNHRFTLISKTKEEKKRAIMQHESQTSSVTIYRIPRMQGLMVSCGVNIIDTPGFIDTRKDFDKHITEQIKELFEKKVTHLDAILIVVPLSVVRLTHGQQHVFSCILNMFGENIRKNIFVATTWDDFGEIKCLAVLKAADIPFSGVFRFNNSNVLSEFQPDDDEASIIGQRYWNARRKAFSMLFKKLETTPKTTVTSSVDVMEARCNLEIQLVALEDSICEQAQHIANYKQNKSVLKETMESQKKKTEAIHKRLEPEIHREFYGKYSLNCDKCSKTCHKNCWVLLESFKWTCKAIKKGKCTVCKGRCAKDEHVFSKDVYEQKYVENIYSDEDAVKMQAKQGEYLQRLQRSLQDITNLIKEINSKALRKNALTLALYVQGIIMKEENEMKQGYQMRIQIQRAIVDYLQNNNHISKLSMDDLLKD